MKKFDIIESQMVPIVTENIDTDQIIPARFLKSTSKKVLVKTCLEIGDMKKMGYQIPSLF